MEIKINYEEMAKKLEGNGIYDYDVLGDDEITRIVTPKQPKEGNICNVYFKDSKKLGLVFDPSLPLVKQLELLKEGIK